MKLIKFITVSLKQIFLRSKNDRSIVSRSNPPSLSSGSASSSTNLGAKTLTSFFGVERSGDWSSEDQLLQVICQIDQYNDMMVPRRELEALLIRLSTEPLSQEEVSIMVSEVADKCDGEVRVEELTSRIGSAWSEGPAGDDRLQKVFLFFDVDCDDRITTKELLQFFTMLGDKPCCLEECRRMIAVVDQNRDGVVCFEDFSRMMCLQRC